MKRKVLAAILVSAMALSMAACGGSSSAPQGGSSTESTTGAEGEAASGEKATVRISYPVLVYVPSDDSVPAVEEALNTYLDSKGVNVTVDLNPIDGNNYATTIENSLLANEDMDIYIPLTGLSGAVSGNKCLALNDYLQNELKATYELMGDELLMSATYNGNVYAIPCLKNSVLTEYWVVEAEAASSVLGLKGGETMTMDEVEAGLAKLKEAYPDKIIMGVRPGANSSPNNFQLENILGGADYFTITDLQNGVCIEGDETKVLNTYATDYFEEVCKTAYEWNKAGYVNKDTSTVSDEAYELVKSGQCLSYFIGYGTYVDPITEPDDTTHGKAVYYIPVENTLKQPHTLNWVISSTSKNPSAAATILDLLFTDPYVVNTVLCGLEGRDYVVVSEDGADRVIDYPEGLDIGTVPYSAWLTCGILGNQFIDWVWVKNDGTVEDHRAEEMNTFQTAPASCIYGFAPDYSNLETEVAAITNIKAQYLGGLVTGELDPEEYIPVLNDALEGAGIQKVIDEVQSQLDAWIAANK